MVIEGPGIASQLLTQHRTAFTQTSPSYEIRRANGNAINVGLAGPHRGEETTI
nr:hypothetical protein Iba_chr02aCG7220 [Ipomoea batatas]GMC64027.1 hypothetical protein Iba_chr02dCG1000 [Ipomoea batatas]